MRAVTPAPLGWAWSKVKHTASFFTGWTPPTGIAEFFEGENLWANISDLGPRVLSDTAKRISDEAVEASGIRKSPLGSVLFSFKLSIGQVSFVGREMYTNEAIATFPPQLGFNPRWAFYALPVFVPFNANENIYGAKLLNQELIRSADLLFPPPCEQERIANFLDEQTARIDALIAEKERLVQLLRKATVELLHAAVTKGLNDVPMKSSGREWIGDVPAHWSVPHIRYVARLESGHTPSRQHPEYWVDCNIPWFSLADVWQLRDGKQEVVTKTSECISELGLANSAARLLPAGTVMLSRTASVGFSGIMGVPMATTQDFVNWVCGAKVLPEYLLYVFRSMGGEFERLKFGSTHSTIYMPDVAKFAMPLPPLEEQMAIVNAARFQKAKMDQLRELAQLESERLREYRSSLISAAVTGQLDIPV